MIRVTVTRLSILSNKGARDLCPESRKMTNEGLLHCCLAPYELSESQFDPNCCSSEEVFLSLKGERSFVIALLDFLYFSTPNRERQKLKYNRMSKGCNFIPFRNASLPFFVFPT